MQINAYLMFDGTCREAFETYARVLGARITALSTFGDSPAAAHVPAEAHGQLIHVRLEGDGWVLMGSDTGGMPYEGIHGVSVSINVGSADEAERVFKDLAEGGKVTMALGKTFWAERFGMLVDRFGAAWMVNFEGSARA
jgi:PhnB protein